MTERFGHDHSKMHRIEEEILSYDRAPQTILELQMSLADELYRMDNNWEKVDLKNGEMRDSIMNYWVDTGYSSSFRLLVDEKTKKGEDPMSITFEELLEFKEGDGEVNIPS